MNLSPHFTLEELTVSQEAVRKGLDNTPNAQILQKLTMTAMKLEEVRSLLSVPLHVSSGYRSPAVNKAVGGAPMSQHLLGEAVDFTAPQFGNPLTVCKAIQASGLKVDQLIHEFGAWVHISFSSNPRGQFLTIDRQGTRAGLLPVR